MRIRLKGVLKLLGKSQSDLGRAVGYSPATIAQLCNHGFWPKAVPQNELKSLIKAALRKWDAEENVLENVFEEWPEPRGNAGRACPVITDDNEDEHMLLRNETLTLEAREHFQLARSPFVDDVNSLDDVFVSASTRRARAALMDAAMHQGFVALVGESGSGKSTLREELEERIRREQRPVIIITPYITEAGKAGRSTSLYSPRQFAEAIVHTLAPGDSVKQSAQARTKQVHDLLRNSTRSGYNNLLVVEEAHRIPKVALRALKNFMELKDGLRRLLGVVLIGQPELDDTLSDRLADVREIVQRCERRTMLPLDDDLQPYLTHKLGRVGANPADVFSDDAYDAIRTRLVRIPRGGSQADAFSICYPLVVNNLVVRGMNAAAAVAMPRVTADVIRGC